jgi:hypothetical protein
MAIWTKEQRVRLASEKQILAQELESFWWEDLTTKGSTTVQGDYRSSSGNSYRLCVRIPANYPDQMPNLYVISPCPLKGFKDKPFNNNESSHAMHTWFSDWNGYVKICHCKDEYWTASDTLFGVLMKGILWLEAFEAHRRNGKNIDNYSLSFK